MDNAVHANRHRSTNLKPMQTTRVMPAHDG